MRKKYEIPKVIVAVPLATPFIYWRTVTAILEMEKPEEADLMVFQGALIDRARNLLVEKMLDHPMKPTHLFFLDADVVPARNTLIRLLAHELPIVSGVYRRRLPPYEPMAFLRRGRRFQPISIKGPRLRKADAVGAGCLLVQRHVFEKVKAPWFASQWTPRGHLSEDFFFCQKAKKAGFQVHVDTSVRPIHVEPMGVTTGQDGRVAFLPLD